MTKKLTIAERQKRISEGLKLSWRMRKKVKMPNTAQSKLLETVLRIKQIGSEIAALSKESKQLRADAVACIDELGMGAVTESEPVVFVVDNLLVSVVKSRGENDFTVTFKDIMIIPKEKQDCG